MASTMVEQPSPSSAAEAEAMALAGLSFLVADSPAGLDAGGQADRLRLLEQVGRRVAAAQAATLSAFTASAGHEGDGCRSPSAWQAVVLGVTRAEAARRWGLAKRLAGLPEGWVALAAGRVAESVLVKIAGFVAGLPQEARQAAAQILLAAAVVDGVTEKDVIALMAAIKEQVPEPQPDNDGGRHEVELSTTIDGVGVLRGRVDAELAALAEAVFAALGKRQGDGDERTIGERNHDALKEALRRVTDGQLLGDVRGRKPHIELTLPLGALRREPGAKAAEMCWSRQAATSLALALCCDAKVSATVTGHAQPAVRLVASTRTMLEDLARLLGGGSDEGTRARPGLHSPFDDAATAGLGFYNWQHIPDMLLTQVIDRMLAWAAEALSGPDGLAARLRRTLHQTLTGGPGRLDDGDHNELSGADGQDEQLSDAQIALAPQLANVLLAATHGISLPLDAGEGSDTVPVRIRQLIERRDQGCRWPGCDTPAHRCHIHHIKERNQGGGHHPTNLILLCSLCRIRHKEHYGDLGIMRISCADPWWWGWAGW